MSDDVTTTPTQQPDPQGVCDWSDLLYITTLCYHVNTEWMLSLYKHGSLTGPPSTHVDKHLKIMRETTWAVRAKWRDIGVELKIDVGTLEVGHYLTLLSVSNSLLLSCATTKASRHWWWEIVSCSQTIERDCCNKAGDCFTRLLEHWLIQAGPPLTWTALTTALKSPSVGREDIAKNIESLTA